MNQPSHPPRRLAAQAGLSLVELMVAMTVSLVISAGAAALFANTILSTRTLNTASQIQELGTQLSQTMARQLRMAGYADWIDAPDSLSNLGAGNNATLYNLDPSATQTVFQTRFTGQTSLHGCGATYTNPTLLTDNSCATVSDTLHSLTIAYQVVSNAQANGSVSISNKFNGARGMSGDCNNQDTKPALIAVNRYYINDSQLMCQGNAANSAAQPVASNVEQFVVTYAMAAPNINPATASPSADELVGAYRTADLIAANEWPRIISARVCLLVVGDTGSLVKAGTSSTSARMDCNATNPAAISLADGRLRQTFVSTVALRNQIHTANQPN